MGGVSWSEQEIERLRTIWPSWPKDAIYAQFPSREPTAIAQYAAVLGIRRPRQRAWKDGSEPIFAELRKLREAAGLTREELARKMGYHLMIVGRWERGEAKPNWFAFRAWLGALGVEIKIIHPEKPLEEKLAETRAKRVCLGCGKALRTVGRHQFMCSACRESKTEWSATA